MSANSNTAPRGPHLAHLENAVYVPCCLNQTVSLPYITRHVVAVGRPAGVLYSGVHDYR